jgi:predicted Zn-dependent protease
MARYCLKREPLHPKVRYFTTHLLTSRHYFDHLREIDHNPELEGADPDTQASWLGYSALRWAILRDFKKAHNCLELAHKHSPADSWVLSCEADVLGYEDRWEESLRAAEAAWEKSPGVPYTVRSLGYSLLQLRRVDEAADRLARAAESCESYEVVLTACWYLAAQAETRTADDRVRSIQHARNLADTAVELAPLADRETLAAIARAKLDLAELADDRAAMESLAAEARSPFHRKVLANFRNNPNGLRIRLPFRHGIQRHNECLPTSIGSAMAAMRTPIDAELMAAELTFGGTPEWAAAEWLEQRGYVVRFFVATPQVAAALVKHGFSFEVTLDFDASAHAVAVVGLDEAAGTLLVHDPNGFRATEYLLDSLGVNEAPIGPKAMIAVTSDKVTLLDQLLPAADVRTMTAREAYRRAEYLHGPEAAREVVARISADYPSHPNTLLLQAHQDQENGRTGAALEKYRGLLERFPGSALVRSDLLACCRSLRNTALMRQTLADVVDRAILPGIEAQQQWRYPPADYVSEYADLLRLSAETSGKAKQLLISLIGRAGFCASAWHNFADLLWYERDFESALLSYRIAACLADRNEHYARAYADMLRRLGRAEEGFDWLRQRVHRFGGVLEGVATWVSLIAELEEAGYPERALAAATEAAVLHPASAELLSFLVPFQARMGNWSEAEGFLEALEKAGNSTLFSQASARFHGMRGELDDALAHAEHWLINVPHSMSAREETINLLAQRDGDAAAIARARQWFSEYPGHEQIEELYCQQLNRTSYTAWRKYGVLLRRVKRNREDSWAWRELAFCAMYDFESANPVLRKRLEPKILRYLDECNRIAPGEAPSLRASAQWLEVRCMWPEAVDEWLAAIELESSSSYSLRHLWDCFPRLNSERRLEVLSRVESSILREPGRCTLAREFALLIAQRFGLAMAEEAVARWMKQRPDDPEVVEAMVDLLLTHGHGRSDDERALALLLPEVERYPFHLGLRLSYANALQNLRRFEEAEQVFHEIVRRHPDNMWSRIRLAWMKQHRGETEAALAELNEAATLEPRNASVVQARVEILIQEQRFAEARTTIKDTLQKLPESVSWRDSAINLLEQCGDIKGAMEAARAGVVQYPRGAHMWISLARTLSEHREFATHGEIEECLRRSLSFNATLYEAADYLAMLLADQRRYSEAEEILHAIERRLGDPSPALGRLAWLRRKRGEKQEALQDAISLVQRFPWYSWGWGILFDWLSEDKSWEEARRALAEVPAEQRTNTRFRQRRLEVLGEANADRQMLDREWKSLLGDFPEELSPHLIRYDQLREAERWPEATEVLEQIRGIFPDSPYVLARWVEVLAHNHEREKAIAALTSLFFAEAEPSVWPPNYAWDALKAQNYELTAYQEVVAELKKGRRPTRRSTALLADYAIEKWGIKERTRQPWFRTWFPHRGAREVLTLMKILDQRETTQSVHRAAILSRLSNFGYERLVVRYWKKHRREVEGGLETWSETIRALTGLKRYHQVRKLFSGWQQRPGVGMWVVTNYVMSLTGVGRKVLAEIRATCRAALTGLHHDHCARYLAYREAEACALLGDTQGFSECWHRYKEYFDGKLEKGEWFEDKRRYLLADLPVLARYLADGNKKDYKRQLSTLRWERIRPRASAATVDKIQWRHIWWIAWLVFLLSRLQSC